MSSPGGTLLQLLEELVGVALFNELIAADKNYSRARRVDAALAVVAAACLRGKGRLDSAL